MRIHGNHGSEPRAREPRRGGGGPGGPIRAALPLRRALSPALALAVAVATAACGAPAFDGTVYRGEDISFRIPAAPSGWERLDVSEAAVAYRDDAHGATIAVNGRCRGEDDVPLTALTQHLFLQFTEQEIVKQEVVPFDGREAMHSVLSAKLDGVPKRFDVWVLKKDGCVYDLIYIADPVRFDAGAPAFERLVRGFATLPAHE